MFVDGQFSFLTIAEIEDVITKVHSARQLFTRLENENELILIERELYPTIVEKMIYNNKRLKEIRSGQFSTATFTKVLNMYLRRFYPHDVERIEQHIASSQIPSIELKQFLISPGVLADYLHEHMEGIRFDPPRINNLSELMREVEAERSDALEEMSRVSIPYPASISSAIERSIVPAPINESECDNEAADPEPEPMEYTPEDEVEEPLRQLQEAYSRSETIVLSKAQGAPLEFEGMEVWDYGPIKAVPACPIKDFALPPGVESDPRNAEDEQHMELLLLENVLFPYLREYYPE